MQHCNTAVELAVAAQTVAVSSAANGRTGPVRLTGMPAFGEAPARGKKNPLTLR